VAPPGPARPPDPSGKGARTRRRLLELAIVRFARDGYRRTSVSAVARDAELSPAAVYAYFDGKEALFEAAVDADAGALIEEVMPAAPAGTLRDRYPAILLGLVDGLDRHPLARRVLAGGEPEVIHRLLALPSLRALRDAVTAEIAAGIERGEVRADLDAAQLAFGLETIVLALLMASLQAGPEAITDRAAAALAVLDAALRPPAG
jgi:AcrR family transcriptional regulator